MRLINVKRLLHEKTEKLNIYKRLGDKKNIVEGHLFKF